MSHYEERLEHDISLIRQKSAELAEKVETAIKNAIQALLTGNHALSYETILRDNVINRDNEEITRMCCAFIARHLPSAGHLRRVTSILSLCVSLERIGDQAAGISKVAVGLTASLDKTMTRHVIRLEEESRHILHQAITSFNEDNIELARSTKLLDSQVDHTFQNAFADLANEDNKATWAIRDLLGLLSVFYSLERVSDLSKNICENTIFSVSGETKKRKPVKILFVAESDNSLCRMAESIGRKSFSRCGLFASAGRDRAPGVDPDFARFMQDFGIEYESNSYTTIEMLPRLDEFNVIIGLQGPVSDYISAVPFNVVVLEWQILAGPGADKQQQFKEMFGLLSAKISDLLEIMRGKEAVCGPS
ncbi:MAG: PhoU domain-containing protein [Desulfocapsaceae bacterium]|nr:PhoU domain-containing protein [Desulfocapsaceae bacterium]